MLIAGFLEFKLDYSEKNLPIGALISSSRPSTVQQASTSSGQHSSGASGGQCSKRRKQPGCIAAQAVALGPFVEDAFCSYKAHGGQPLVEEAVALREVAHRVWERTGNLREGSGAGRVSGAPAERASRS
jgi:hypothetical protein